MVSKTALLIGINYRGTDGELRGCINDVENTQKYLCEYRGYQAENITILTDDTPLKPTGKNIIDNIIKLFSSGADQLWLSYSGHGCFIKDTSGDEEDGNDEALVPLDYGENGVILDDHLRGLFSFLKPNSELRVVLDCCHSGTGMDLAFNLLTVGKIGKFRKGWKLVRDKKYQPLRNKVIVISGCLDSQTSADATINRQPQGALTFALLKVLTQNPKCNFEELITTVRLILSRRKFGQTASLSCSQNLNIKTTFF